MHMECLGCCLQLCCDVGFCVAFAFDDDAAVDGRNGLNHLSLVLATDMLTGRRGDWDRRSHTAMASPVTDLLLSALLSGNAEQHIQEPRLFRQPYRSIDFTKTWTSRRAPGGIRRVLHANAVCIRSLTDSETTINAKHS